MISIPESDIYYSIASVGEGFYKEKGSKFISYAYPATNQDEIRVHLETLKKQYYDARHHCYAWRLGSEGTHVRANDDGEPNHSAGDPILGQIRSANLTDALVVVVRYFGGTKLGVSGLIHAYRVAAHEALQQAVVKECVVRDIVTLAYPYENTQEVMRLLDEYPVKIEEQVFEADCKVKLGVPYSLLERFSEEVGKLPAVQLS
ncbi:MAG TPA: YigZ family protein [Cytophagales bacterium]|nr:YigZ family protein [Cytophagales bacterium]HAA22534.1 YigZ family protein [Cytophagales bacterium]HAP61404.1 YigZ family protein [Cytophagales bacterium]